MGHTYPEANAVWCVVCVKENLELIYSLGIVGSAGPIGIYGGSELNLSYPENVKKMQAIPKKGQASVPVAPITVEIKEKVEVKFDFDFYNKTFAGKQYG
jgi:hypothetical protein